MVLTSPPYHKQRYYDTEPVIWLHHSDHHDNDTSATSVLVNLAPATMIMTGLSTSVIFMPGRGDCQRSGKYSEQEPIPDRLITTYICKRCGAFKGELGQEPTSEMYIEHLMQVFDQVRRVLVDEGSLWVVIGDKYGPDKSLELVPEQFVIAMKKRGWLVRGK